MPLIASSAIGAAGSIGGGLIGSKSSKKAAKQAAGARSAASTAIGTATNDANARSEEVLKPYLEAGSSGVDMLRSAFEPGGELREKFAFDPMNVAETPEYKFQLEQGTQAVQRSAAARGGLFSGGTLKGLTQFSQGLASTAYQQAYNNALTTFQTNRNNLFGGLTALTGVGQNAVGQEQNALSRFLSGNVDAAKMYAGVGDAQAQGTANAGASWVDALQGITSSIQGGLKANSSGLQRAPVTDQAATDQVAMGIPQVPMPRPPQFKNPYALNATNDAYNYMGIE